MAHTKSVKKTLRQLTRRRARNVAVRSRMKTLVKHAAAAMEAKDMDRLKGALPAALSEIDRAAQKGVIHKNTAARKKSALQQRAAALQQ